MPLNFNIVLCLSVDLDLSAKQEQQLTEIFDLFDTDGGGTMDRDEFRVAMFALGFQGRASLGDAGRSVGLNQVGALTLEEFMALMKGELTCQVLLSADWHDCVALEKLGVLI